MTGGELFTYSLTSLTFYFWQYERLVCCVYFSVIVDHSVRSVSSLWWEICTENCGQVTMCRDWNLGPYCLCETGLRDQSYQTPRDIKTWRWIWILNSACGFRNTRVYSVCSEA